MTQTARFKIDPDLSQRITFLRFPLIALVVFIHASNSIALSGGARLEEVYPGSVLQRFLTYFISSNIALTAVPLLFVISSYLFFAGFEFTWQGYVKKLQSRIKTLLIPYLFWNTLALIFFTVVGMIPGLSSFAQGGRVVISSPLDILRAYWAVPDSPVLYPFWFMRDLMVLFIVAPLFYFLAKKLPYPTLFVFLLWLMHVIPFPLERINLPQPIPIFFFFVGAVAALQNWQLKALEEFQPVFIVLYLMFATGFSWAQATGAYIVPYPDVIFNAVLCLGVVAVCCVAGYRIDPLDKTFSTLAQYAFFVYATHEPLLTGVRKLLYRFAPPGSTFMQLAYYFIPPLAVIAITILVGWLLRKYALSAFSFVTGGR